ncbi:MULTISPECIES: MarR family transcriptional regulator [unclassified Actinomyces]|uniref:MarR family winged helix-turn-helix transcriptional regulator n=1 Tax=unclassified Actinomyces TaxID=2609248 RepID=UPI0020179D53|nr:MULTISPECIES: MarR family transcriptional regulator [unclassified Actinomyces]MCL3776955.1 MarR family transcriptional regulator [Actinomyces sp. AC-20-1]MCL3790241.1 MarR family transcriptional regulator [Actinomyces sp. 187325]MCL3793121.1 MarR family transcriptional regulator [Actinomyces sp. 186855]MCL3795518.1 MarR family transcriptional regulator [Actinomyces sp. 217892]
MSTQTPPSAQAPADGCGQQPPSAPDRGRDHLTRGLATLEDTSVLDTEEMAAWRAFLSASLGVTARLNHELEASAGISLHEYEILVRLSEAEGMSMRMSALADRVSHSRSRLTHTVGRLEKEGYVRRGSCPSDRRGVVAELTEDGLAFLRRTAPLHLAGVRRHVIDRVPPAQRAAFTALMSALVDEGEGL